MPAPLVKRRAASARPASSPRFFAIGDTALDVFVEIEQDAVHCESNTKTCQISFAFGEKVPVKDVQKFPGAGNASNAAVAAKRLGQTSAILATIGADAAGKLILEHWKNEGVDTSYVSRSRELATNEHIVLTHRGERTILIHHHPYPYALPKRLPTPKRVYYTSLGSGHEEMEQALVGFLDTHSSIRVTFQPGTFQLKRGARGTKAILAKTDILVMNKEEAARFLETPVSTPIQSQLTRFLELGPRIAVITDGEQGSYAADADSSWFCPSFPVPCVERTGAGDSYATTLTWAIDKGFSLPEAMRYGTANAASVIQHIGPQAGLLSREGVERWMKKYASVKPKPLC